eukprot:CAMPEP_0170554970 /NCGR_PEP_ID=MMETSP0211-20121228/12845_1 /TAXON_ID=311385 /ORGANISM="Pseudokeronopsis sp., Strain OXSARD2" /LENGTH=220 /DNA_ID=CAMNT_0010864443 /DNA_START=1329 /DNA_END=1991 /DNA_ORIENTATION=-
MGMQVLVHYDRVALLIGTVYSPEVAHDFMRLHVLPLQSDLTAIFKETLTLVRTLNYFQGTVNVDVSFQLSPLHHPSTAVLALNLILRALIFDMLVHVIERKHEATIEEALNYSVGTFLVLVDFQVFPQDSPTKFIVRTHHWSKETCFQVLFNVSLLDDIFALIVEAGYTELIDQPLDRDVGLEVPNNSLVAQGALGSFLDAFLTKQVVAARGLHSIFKYV